jgi:catechol 2,3-dioxygenase-like lactoylglutathione lyase family enzyme
MIDHLGLAVSDLAASRAFYDAALAPLGYQCILVFDDAVGFGVPPKPDFWLSAGEPGMPTLHVAFGADSRAVVDAFYRAAIDAGGRDNGAPGLRAHYHPNYYGAFVLDPDGHNIEAVCHRPA